jgi:RimJ/RimL family protein N-acetyltransferase
MIGCMPVLADLTWPKHTERLTLRPAIPEDFKALWHIRRQDSVARWMTSRSTDWDGFVEVMGDEDRLRKTLVIERDDVVIGDLMLAPEDAWAQSEVKDRAKGVQAEIGWCIDPAVEGNGYATEAVVELIRVAFEELGLRRLIANCFADNTPSWRLMERVGMRRELYAVSESLHRSGEWLDGMMYALLADEWRSRPSSTAPD